LVGRGTHFEYVACATNYIFTGFYNHTISYIFNHSNTGILDWLMTIQSLPPFEMPPIRISENASGTERQVGE